MIRGQLAGEQSLVNQLRVLQLKPGKRKLVLRKLGRMARDAAKKRITQQQNLDSTRFAPRRRKRNARQKMLRGLKKGYAINATADVVTVQHQNALTGRIAYAQQHGLSEVMTPAKAAKRGGGGNPDAKPATRIQARQLLAEGFVIRGPGKYEKQSGKRVYVPGVRKKASVQWITANLVRSQAGAILRSLRGQAGQSSWVIPGTPRSFLGAAPGDVDDMLGTIFNSMKTA